MFDHDFYDAEVSDFVRLQAEQIRQSLLKEQAAAHLRPLSTPSTEMESICAADRYMLTDQTGPLLSVQPAGRKHGRFLRAVDQQDMG